MTLLHVPQAKVKLPKFLLLSGDHPHMTRIHVPKGKIVYPKFSTQSSYNFQMTRLHAPQEKVVYPKVLNTVGQQSSGLNGSTVVKTLRLRLRMQYQYFLTIKLNTEVPSIRHKPRKQRRPPSGRTVELSANRPPRRQKTFAALMAATVALTLAVAA